MLPLKSAITFYNKVSLRDMLQHLATSTAGLEATDIVSLFLDMQAWWEEDPRVPEYINRLEEEGSPCRPTHHQRVAGCYCLQVSPHRRQLPHPTAVWDAKLPATKTARQWQVW
jgi:hypothetical protein